MAHVSLVAPELELEEPTLVDGLPGMGLVGKLAADHLVGEFDMEYVAGVYCEGVPSVAAYRRTDPGVRPPVQLHADGDRDLLALTSDVPVSPSGAPDFAECITDWLVEHDATPIFVSGLDGDGENEEEVVDGAPPDGRALYGVAAGDGGRLLDDVGIERPPAPGIVTGPTGALLHRAGEVGHDGVGLLVESDGSLPDVEAARTLVDRGIEPLAGLEIDTEPFVERTVELSHVAREAVERLGRSADGGHAEPTPTFY